MAWRQAVALVLVGVVLWLAPRLIRTPIVSGKSWTPMVFAGLAFALADAVAALSRRVDAWAARLARRSGLETCQWRIIRHEVAQHCARRHGHVGPHRWLHPAGPAELSAPDATRRAQDAGTSGGTAA